MHKTLVSRRQTSLADSTDHQRVAWTSRLALPCALAATLLLAAGCATRSPGNVLVEDQGTGTIQPGGEIKPPLPGAENASKPLCDGAISAILLRKGVRVARRTVAKYREGMKIVSAPERRVEVPMAVAV